MDEMNNVMTENETAMESTPVEVVPSSAVDVTCNDERESKSGMGMATIVAGGLALTGVTVGIVAWAAPKVKKVIDNLKDCATKRKEKNSVHVEEVVEETSDEE